MNASSALAEAYGVAIDFADLGDWMGSELCSEYDPAGPVIRINLRVVERLDPRQVEEFIALAIGHELYHHREFLGEVAPVRGRARREAAAEAYARALLAQT